MGNPALGCCPEITRLTLSELWTEGYGPGTGDGEDEEGEAVGKGDTKTGINVEELTFLASPILGHTSKRVVKLKNTLFALTTPRFTRSDPLAPPPLSIHLKL